jgi:peroxiredoxin
MASFAQAQAPAAPPKTHLKVGDAAPDFTVASIAGKPVSLKDFKGTKGVVLAFFPAAFTGGCTKEMTAYQANLTHFKDLGSTDNTPSLKYWADNVIKPEFNLASDFATRKAAKDYGVLMPERGIANRATFVISTSGKIEHIEEGSGAVDISGASNACSRLAKH